MVEEPGDKTVFIFIAEDRGTILKTLDSRCQKIYFKEHSNSELKSYAEKHLKIDSLDEIIDLSMGSIGQLINTNSDTSQHVKEMVDFFPFLFFFFPPFSFFFPFVPLRVLSLIHI